MPSALWSTNHVSLCLPFIAASTTDLAGHFTIRCSAEIFANFAKNSGGISVFVISYGKELDLSVACQVVRFS
jgi:hypothetical protein